MGVQDEILAKYKNIAESAPSSTNQAVPSAATTPPSRIDVSSQQDAILEKYRKIAPNPSPPAPSPISRATTPAPESKGFLQKALEFIPEKIDKPARRAVGLPETGMDLVNRVGATNAPIVPSPLAPSENPKYRDYYQQNPMASASLELFNKIPQDAALATAYELAASPLNLTGLLPKALGALGLGKLARGKAAQLAETATGATRVQAEKFRPGTGQILLDEGIVGFGKSPAGIAEAAKTKLKETGENIQKVLTDLEAKGAPTTNRDELADKMFNKARELKRQDSEIARQTGDALDDIAERFSSAENKNLPLTAIEKEKRDYAKLGRYDKRNPIPAARQDAYKEASEVLRGHTEEVATRMDPALANLFGQEKELYGVLAPVEKAAMARAKQLQQHPIGGFLDTMSALGGALGGGSLGFLHGGSDVEKAALATIMGLGSAMGRRVVAPRAASTMASALNSLPAGSEMLVKMGVPSTQIAKMTETPEGLNTLNIILKDVAGRQQPQDDSMLGRLKRRNKSR